VPLAESLEQEQPLVKVRPTDPEWILLTLLGAGDEAVERHGDVHPQLAHRMLLF
jgi:hypothetical protein